MCLYLILTLFLIFQEHVERFLHWRILNMQKYIIILLNKDASSCIVLLQMKMENPVTVPLIETFHR